MNEIRDRHFIDELVQYGREYLLTDVDDLVWEWLKQSHFVDRKIRQQTEANPCCLCSARLQNISHSF